MDGKLNQEGYLLIFRDKKFKVALCPYQTNRPCGDWCALFEEPTEPKFHDSDQSTTLTLCKKTYTFDKFKNDRGKQ